MRRETQAVRQTNDEDTQASYLLGELEQKVAQEKQPSPKRYPSAAHYIGIFMTSASVLLFELALTRIFAVILWAHLAFMVVSTALFGFGLSGVFLALRPKTLVGKRSQNFGLLALCISVSIILAYITVTQIPFRMWHFHEDPLNYFYLAVWYAALVIPFFFAGLLIAELLSSFPLRSGRLYGVDLVGAAAGSLLLVPVIPALGGEGTVVFASILAALAGLAFSLRQHKRLALVLAVFLVALSFVLPQADTLLPMKFHQNKRRYNAAMENNRVMATRWSTISRVDIAEHRKGILDIWIDGGTNESAIIGWSGNMEKLRPMQWSSIGVIHNLKQGSEANVLIIGPSGGKEVLFALSHGASHVDAVELDPSIVKLVGQSPFKEFMGGLYQNDKVTLVNDEGRAFMRRQPEGIYDIVQFVNNYTPVAIAAGALNLSETFLITKEAFHDYLDHLAPNGVLALHRGATLRVALTAIEALRERGVEEPEKQIMITAGEVPFFEGFFLKNGKWTKEEEVKIHSYMKIRRRVGGKTFLWTPFDPGRKNLYSRVLSSSPEEQRGYFTSLGLNLTPATDNQPFVEHYLQLGKTELASDVPIEFVHRNDEKWRGIIPRGDFPYVAILVESALLALLFVGLPLLLGARGSLKGQGFFGFLTYFSALGFGFIVVEICLMKRYVLFLGNPAYSLTTILVALLLGAGIGSMVSEKLGEKNPRKTLAYVIPGLAILLLCETLISPLVFETFLGVPFIGRILIASMLLLPLGFVMGMPFPLGLRLISLARPDEAERTKLVAWAWGMNGYCTVIGSAATVFIALYAGFKAALVLALVAYLIGLIAIQLGTRHGH